MRDPSAYFERETPHPRLPAHPIQGLAGTSLKPQHLQAILAGPTPRGFFEIHAENYMGAGGPPHRALEAIRRDHPVSLHGVCMSIGGPLGLDKAHLARFGALVRALRAGARVRASRLVDTRKRLFQRLAAACPTRKRRSRRCAITSTRCRRPSAGRCCSKIRRPIVLFRDSTMSETDFIRAVARRTGCGLLLDVNNVFVSATNHGFSPRAYLADFPLPRSARSILPGMPKKATTKARRCSSTATTGPSPKPSGACSRASSPGQARSRR